MSDEAPEKSSKTEDPSQKKLDDAHKKGDVAKSQEVTTWFMIAGSGLLFALMASPTSSALTESLKDLLANADQFEVGGSGFGAFFGGLAGSILLVALMSLLQASLSLPGIAGIVLTVGMAADANILIYERVREEDLKQNAAVLAWFAYNAAMTDQAFTRPAPR